MDTNALEAIFGYRFKDQDLLSQALRHASAAKDRTNSNERLEFLGDRVLGLIIAAELYRRFPEEEEGELAQRYAGLTCQDALVRVAEAAGLEEFVRTGGADAETLERSRPAMLSDTLEAVLGALFLDGGLEAAAPFILKRWEPLILEDLRPPKDAKTALQEWTQANGMGLPNYHSTGRTGPDHAPTFTVEVRIGGHPAASGEGASKRDAEQAAARAFLNTLKGKKK